MQHSGPGRVRTTEDVQAFVQCAYEFVQEMGFEEARRAFHEDERWRSGPLGPIHALGDAVEFGEEVDLCSGGFGLCFFRLPKEIVDQHLRMNLFLNVERRACFRFFGFGIGVMNSTRRRLSRTRCVGWPSASSSQCRWGHS